MTGRTPKGAPLAFIADAVASATDECIIWPYNTTKGYGRINLGGKIRQAHRVSLERATGLTPGLEMDACHAPGTCHNRACINPRHLRWASRSENNLDKVADGTHTRGERAAGVKLTAAQALAIRNDPRPLSAIASEYGVSKQHVSLIRKGRKWAWLGQEAAA